MASKSTRRGIASPKNVFKNETKVFTAPSLDQQRIERMKLFGTLENNVVYKSADQPDEDPAPTLKFTGMSVAAQLNEKIKTAMEVRMIETLNEYDDKMDIEDGTAKLNG